MIEQPRLKAHLSAHVVEPDEVFLLGDDRQHLIESRAAVLIVPLLDGRRSSAQIALELSSRAPFMEVMAALAALERGGHLVDGVEAGPEAAWWEAAGADAAAAADAVAASRVVVRTLGEVPEAGAVIETLHACGLDAIRDGAPAQPGDLVLVLVEDYLEAGLEDLNRRMLDAKTPWLLAKAQGETLWLGPFFRPGESACASCLTFRLVRNRHVESYVKRRNGSRPRRPAATAPGAAQLAGAMLARELQEIAATGESSVFHDTVLTIRRDLGTLEHHVVRRPQCPECGAGTDAYGDGRIEIGPAPKRLLAGGAYRSMSTEETLAVLEKHVSPISGAVAWLADLSEPDESGHAFWAGHWFPILGSERGAAVLRQNVRGRSGGKGATEAAARTSAICESLERYSGVFFGDEPRILTTRDELGERALPFEQLVQYSDEQYRNREAWNAAQHSELQIVAGPLPGDRAVDWTTVWPLLGGEARYVPTAYCYYGHPDIGDWDTFFCSGDSNGQGAGNTLEEALTQGLFELSERDGVAIWWYNRLRLPAVDLDTFDDPWVERIRQEYAENGREVWALDLTTDIGIPVFVAVSKQVEGPEDLIFGFGSHLEPQAGADPGVQRAQPVPAGRASRRERRVRARRAGGAGVVGDRHARERAAPGARPGRAHGPARGLPGPRERRPRRGPAHRGRAAERGRPGGLRGRPVAAGHRAADREGAGARDAALLAPARAGPALRRTGEDGPARRAVARGPAQPQEHLVLTCSGNGCTCAPGRRTTRRPRPSPPAWPGSASRTRCRRPGRRSRRWHRPRATTRTCCRSTTGSRCSRTGSRPAAGSPARCSPATRRW